MRVNSMDTYMFESKPYMGYLVAAIMCAGLSYLLLNFFYDATRVMAAFIWERKYWVLAIIGGLIVAKRWLGKRKNMEVVYGYPPQ